MTNRIDDELSDFEYDDSGSPEVKDPVSESKPVEETPTGLAGKSVEELIEMNKEAQKQISRQGNEIGELRKFTDDYLKKELEKETEEYDDYDKEVVQIAEKVANSKVKAIEERMEAEVRQRRFDEFETAHPDWRKEAENPAFQKWVAESKFRSRMYQEADNHDFEAADELFNEWEDVSKDVKSMEDEEKASALNAAKVETSGGSSKTKRIYSRAELINLKVTDPAKYARHADEIRLAYAENRVK